MIDLAIDDRVSLDNSIDCALQEIDMLFNTYNTELIGDPEYGTNFEQFLWNFTTNTEDIERYIRRKIFDQTYFARQLEYDITVEEVPGEQREIYYITIKITSPVIEDEAKSTRVYMIQ